jgi:hypothetical protein
LTDDIVTDDTLIGDNGLKGPQQVTIQTLYNKCPNSPIFVQIVGILFTVFDTRSAAHFDALLVVLEWL